MNACSSYAVRYAILCVPIETEDAMRELQSEVVGDRRISLVEHQDGRYAVTITVWGPLHNWEDISLGADQGLAFHTAARRYRQRVAEQQARILGWRI
jgi:hypothetical protein